MEPPPPTRLVESEGLELDAVHGGAAAAQRLDGAIGGAGVCHGDDVGALAGGGWGQRDGAELAGRCPCSPKHGLDCLMGIHLVRQAKKD